MPMATAYYNEIDPKAAAWLRELIARGHIAAGEVDERDIRDVRPADLVRFTQCHFFAGIGVWSYAARRAGWRDEWPLWSASLPCQPWSDAGAGKGFEDDRHLWPTFEALRLALRLALRPVVAVGEQVASKDGLAWLDAVQADVEASGDAFGAVDLCSAGFGAPHIRQRLHWVAYAQSSGSGAGLCDSGPTGQRRDLATDGGTVRGMANTSSGGCGEFWDALVAGSGGHADGSFVAGRLGDAAIHGCEGIANRGGDVRRSSGPPVERASGEPSGPMAGATRGVEHADRCESATQSRDDGEVRSLQEAEREPGHRAAISLRRGSNGGPGPTNGLWRTADWLACRDGKWRPVEPGTFPLAHGAPARVGRLRGYGNAINAEVATAFIEAVMDHLADQRREQAAA